VKGKRRRREERRKGGKKRRKEEVRERERVSERVRRLHTLINYSLLPHAHSHAYTHTFSLLFSPQILFASDCHSRVVETHTT
jgi:hypothetical protein